MRIKFVGTGAADWTCPCEDGELRRFTCTLIDERLLIDISIGALEGIGDTAKIRDVLFTHSHSDHFDLEALKMIAPVNVYAHESWAHEIEGEGLNVIPLKLGEQVEISDYKVLPLPSNHSSLREYETTLHYMIERQDKRILYATDGAWLLNSEYRLIKSLSLDAAVFDATIGDGHEGDYRIFEHNSVEMVRIMTATLKHTGILKSEAPVFLTHMAKTLHPNQKQIEAGVKPPLIACYDGMEYEL